MVLIRSSSGSDAFYSGDNYVFVAPIKEWQDPGSCLPVIHSVGMGGNAIRALGYDTGGGRVSILKVAEKCAVLTIDAGGLYTFGNDTAIAAVDAAVEWFQDNLGAGSNGRPLPFMIMATSMGFGDTMAWARTRPSAVCGAIGIIPLTSLNGVYTRNPTLTGVPAQTRINDAYGGTYINATHGPTHDPTQFASQLKFPIKIFYSSDDPLLPLTDHQGFAAAAPNCELINLGAHAHNDTALSAAAATAEFNKFVAERSADWQSWNP